MKTTHAVQFLLRANMVSVTHTEFLESEGLGAWYVVTIHTGGRLKAAEYAEHVSREAAFEALAAIHSPDMPELDMGTDPIPCFHCHRPTGPGHDYKNLCRSCEMDAIKSHHGRNVEQWLDGPHTAKRASMLNVPLGIVELVMDMDAEPIAEKALALKLQHNPNT